MVISDKFILNGIEGVSKDISLVTFDSEILINKGIPFSRSVNAVDGYSQFNPIFSEEDVVPEDVVLNFIYTKNGVPQIWTESKMLEIKKWVITNDFIPFITQDNPNYTYYIKCKKIQNRITPYGLGVLECTFTPLSHFAYKKVNTTTTVSRLSSVTIQNPSVYNYKPIIQVKNLGSTSTINKIGNFQITGLSANEVVIIDNLMLSVVNSSGVNRFANCNRGWLELTPGENILEVNGLCEIQILCEFPIVL